MYTNTWTRKALLTAIALGLAGTASAGEAPKSSAEEAVGFGTGGVIGAIAGGPVGFMVGAAIGSKIGDTLHTKNEQIASLDSANEISEISVNALRRDVDALSADLESAEAERVRLERIAHPGLVSLMQVGLDLDLLFRTDEHTLLADTEERLRELGTRLAGMNDVQVHLDGFADERGDVGYNQKLSAKRVAYVRDQLVAAGVDPARISEVAHGEVAAAEPTADSYALERRVSLKVYIDRDTSVASNP